MKDENDIFVINPLSIIYEIFKMRKVRGKQDVVII